MGSRLYDEFMKKLKVPTIRRQTQDEGSEGASTDLVISIPLKGGQGVSLFTVFTIGD